MGVQTITRKGSFDSMHRVMNERMKCFNVHGHTYLYELTFRFWEMQEIGYAIDFKEIKRVACQFIDDYFDHAAILNPKDEQLIQVCSNLNSKVWLMSLNGQDNYCNPTVENIGKEVFLCIKLLMKSYPGLELDMVRIYETPNCFCDTFDTSIQQSERDSFIIYNGNLLADYSLKMGVVEYDDTKIVKQSINDLNTPEE